MLGTNNSSKLARRRRVPQGVPQGVPHDVTNREVTHSPTPISRAARRAEAELQKPRNHFDRHPSHLKVQQPELLVKPGQIIQTQRSRQARSLNQKGFSSPGFSWRNLFKAATAPPLPPLKSSSRPESLSRRRPGLYPVERSGQPSNLTSNLKMQISTRRTVLRSGSQRIDSQPDLLTGGMSRKIKPLSQKSAASAPKLHLQKPRRPRRPVSPLLHIVRFLILGVGIGAIAGTLLAIFNPVLRSGEFSQSALSVGQPNPSTGPNSGAIAVSATPAVLQLGDRLTTLTTKIQNLTTQYIS
jgi:hypothetical protein